MSKTEEKYPHLDRVVMGVILINSIIIFLQTSGYESRGLDIADSICTLIFIAEMLLKMKVEGFKGYWQNGWNRFDGTLVILSLPSLLAIFFPVANLSLLLIFRLLRILRFLRTIKFFGDEAVKIAKNFKKAMNDSKSLFIGYFIVICIFALLSTSLFGQAAPQFFGTPF